MKMSDNPTEYEVLIEQYLRSILDISDFRLLTLEIQLVYGPLGSHADLNIFRALG